MPRHQLEIKRVQTDEEGNLTESIGCHKCGYDLQGLYREGVCPECGTPVGLSTQGDYLRYCDPRWVKKLAKGMNHLLAASVLFALSVLFVMFLSFSFRLGDDGSTVNTAYMVLACVWIAVWVLIALGCWTVTSPDSSRPRNGVTVRQVARVCLTLAVVLEIADQVAGFVNVALSTGVLSIVGWVAALVGFIALLAYLRQLANRAPDPRLSTQTLIITYGVGLLVVIRIVMGFIAGLSGNFLRDTGGFGCAFLVVAAVFSIWAFLIALMYQRVFVAAANTAIRGWYRARAN